MSQLQDHDEQEALKQDEFFKQTLISVKPFILNLTCAEDAQLCKIWLDKLNLSSFQRSLRNEYLLELCQQLKRGHVGGIFSKPPPLGPLLPLHKPYRMVYISSSLSDLSEFSTTSYHKQERTNEHKTHSLNAVFRIQDTNSTNTSQCSHMFEQSSDQFNDNNIGDRNQFITHSHDTDSPIYKNKVAEQFSKLKFQLHEAECKNESLNNNLLTMSQKLDKIIHDEEEEINAIKKQCIDKLESMRQQYEVFLKEKDLEINTQIDLIRQKDLELLKKDEEGNKRIELLTNKIKEMEIKLETETKDENKLRAMLTDQNAIMRQEFDKMRSKMELVSQNQNENLISKTIMLKKIILKLKKSKDKLVYDYETKINHILKSKDMEIKSLCIQFQGQKTDLYISLYSEKQRELNALVNSLEEKYKLLFAAADETAENQRQNYLKKINILENELCQLKKRHS
ncbi:PREDICTED: centrosomal protein of 112 kDa-like, partial [Polistes dominula]|uniref:Centrosomal protein of 112 kDa-like n=1 Tax=Polistes dominula TaxID=743375 RepID=A0ABM1JEV3_POLDO